nr:hypothetical protein CFP56_20995 [Quercus suber]
MRRPQGQGRQTGHVAFGSRGATRTTSRLAAVMRRPVHDMPQKPADHPVVVFPAHEIIQRSRGFTGGLIDEHRDPIEHFLSELFAVQPGSRLLQCLRCLVLDESSFKPTRWRKTAFESVNSAGTANELVMQRKSASDSRDPSGVADMMADEDGMATMEAGRTSLGPRERCISNPVCGSLRRCNEDGSAERSSSAYLWVEAAQGQSQSRPERYGAQDEILALRTCISLQQIDTSEKGNVGVGWNTKTYRGPRRTPALFRLRAGDLDRNRFIMGRRGATRTEVVWVDGGEAASQPKARRQSIRTVSPRLKSAGPGIWRATVSAGRFRKAYGMLWHRRSHREARTGRCRSRGEVDGAVSG